MKHTGFLMSLMGIDAMLSSLFTYKIGIVGGFLGIGASAALCGLFFIIVSITTEKRKEQ